MAQITGKVLAGLGVPIREFTYALRDTTEINATEADKRPGSAVGSSATAMLHPEVHGPVQSVGVDVLVTKSGRPGNGPEGCRVAHRQTGATHWRGYTSPHLQTGAQWMDGFANIAGLARQPTDGSVLCVYGQAGTSAVVGSRVWDPATGEWSAEVAIGANVDLEVLAATALPNGLLYALVGRNDGGTAQVSAYTSDDAGATWTLASDDVIAPGDIDVAFSGGTSDLLLTVGDDLLWIHQVYDGTNMVVTQWVSTDLGASFLLVREWETMSATGPARFSGGVLPDGRIVVVFQGASREANLRHIGSVWEPVEDVDTAGLSTSLGSYSTIIAGWFGNVGGTVETLSCHVDEDGLIHLYVVDDTSKITYHVSLTDPTVNGAQTYWGDPTSLTRDPVIVWNTTSIADYMDLMWSISSMGRQFLLATQVASTGSIDDMLMALEFGGWSEAESKLSITATGTTANHVLGVCPWELPHNLGTHWTRTGSGGTWSISLLTGVTNLTTVAATDYQHHDYGAAFVDYVIDVAIGVNSGGDVAGPTPGIHFTSADGVNRYWARLNFSQADTAFRVEYNVGLDQVTVDTTWDFSALGPVQVKASLDSTNELLDVWYRALGGETWTRVVGAPFALIQAAAAANSTVNFGSTFNGTGDSDWHILQVGVGATGTLALLTGTGVKGKVLGVDAYPLPEIGEDANIARLMLSRGPGFIGETYDLDPVGDRPVSNIYPDVSPSPRVPWRSADTTTQTFASWDLSASGGGGPIPGRMIAIYLGRMNVPNVLLRRDSGAGFVSDSTIDPSLDFNAVNYTRTGNQIRARTTAGLDGARYIWRNEFAGAWVDLGSGKRRKIAGNTAGEWRTGPDADTAKAILFLEGVDDTEPASGACTIYSHSVVFVTDNVTAGEQWQLQALSGSNADGYFEIGVVRIFEFAAFGRAHSRGWQWQRELNAETRQTRSGTVYATELGDPPRTLTLAWTDGLKQHQIRTRPVTATPIDYLAGPTGDPLIGRDDVAMLLDGLVAEVRSGQDPVLALPYVVTTGAPDVITDPSRFVYGRIASDVEYTHVVGDESTGEFVRVGNLAIRGLV